MAYQQGYVGIHAPIKVRVYKEIDGEMRHGLIDATVGRLIFNEAVPQDLGFVDRSRAGAKCSIWRSPSSCGKKQLGKIIDRLHQEARLRPDS